MIDHTSQDSVVLAVVLEQRRNEVTVELADGLQRNTFRAHRGTLTNVGAAAESFSVVLRDASAPADPAEAWPGE